MHTHTHTHTSHTHTHSCRILVFTHLLSHAYTHIARTHSTHRHKQTHATHMNRRTHTRASIWAILICFLPLALDTSSADEMSADSDVLFLLFFACAPHNQLQSVRV